MNRPAAEPPIHTDADDVGGGNRRRRRARFELIFASIWLLVGLLVLPAAIFAVGGALLGPYGDNGGLGRFYGDFFGDLFEPSVRAWAIALGPLVLISILRLVFAGAGREPEKPAAERPAPPRRSTEDHRRVEPRVSTE
ncbi:MAG TPA: hypothetical protein VH814_04430 [Steroidobacteraceae bacterium]|jgi:hypothetical protein